MKKFAIIVAAIAASVPGFINGLDTERTINQDNRDAMLRERFFSWCAAEGYRLDTMSENASETLWIDVWAETEDYQAAADSIDRVLRDRKISYFLK